MRVRVRLRVGDGRGPMRAASKTDERGEIIYSKEKRGVVRGVSELRTIRWCECQLSVPINRKMLAGDLEELE